MLFLPAIEEASSKTVAIKTTLNPENNNVCFMETCFCFLATQMLSELRCFFYKVNLIFCKKNFYADIGFESAHGDEYLIQINFH